MATLQQQAKGKKDGDIRYLSPLKIETQQRTREVTSTSSYWNFTKIPT